MAKRTSKYAGMNASDLLNEMRSRKLEKPEGMLNISELADFLEEQDVKAASTADTKPNKVAEKTGKNPVAAGVSEEPIEPVEEVAEETHKKGKKG